MLMSHSDSDHVVETKSLKEVYEKQLQEKAEQMTQAGLNKITAGELHGEKVIEEELVGMFIVRQLPEDPLALRISIGEGNMVTDGLNGYLVFRGDPQDIGQLLEGALSALKASHFKW